MSSTKPDLPLCDDYRAMLLSGEPFIDVRAPIEYRQGSLPTAINLPLMNDEERAAVGTCYKKNGQDAAIALGHKRVSGAIKAQRIEAWRKQALAAPQGYLYCARGGLRSQLSQQWLANEGGIRYTRVKGGYKALRQFLIDCIDRNAQQQPLLILGGYTGTGKTDLLQTFRFNLDLEHCANHRGSGFGRRVSPQPTQIDFENRIAIRLLHLEEIGVRGLLVEDEGSHIGSCRTPFSLFKTMQDSPKVWLEEPLERRCQRIIDDYIVNMQQDFAQQFPEQDSFTLLADHLRQSLDRLQKRLGLQRQQYLLSILNSALSEQAASNDYSGHKEWINALLQEYYDPMYDYHFKKHQPRLLYRGNAADMRSFIGTWQQTLS